MAGDPESLFPDMPRPTAAPEDDAGAAAAPPARPRLAVIDRNQLFLREVDVEKLIEEDHPARAIWELLGRVDLSGYEQAVRAVDGVAGRPALPPRLLISLWIYGYSRGVGSAREMARLCSYEPAFQWLTAASEISGHTLSDFRVAYRESLDKLFAEVLGVLSAEGLIQMERVTQDGTKIRARAASDSFRSQDGVAAHLETAREQVAEVAASAGEEGSERQEKARQRARHERLVRTEAAAREFDKLRAAGEPAGETSRVSTTDPEARKMKQPDGGFAPSYNVQTVTDAAHGIVVAVEATQAGNDFDQLTPMMEKVEETLGARPGQVLADGGYVSRPNIVDMAGRGIEFIGPVGDSAAQAEAIYERRGVSVAFRAENFRYDEAHNCFGCPAGKTLAYEGKSESRLQINYKYRARAAECMSCPHKAECCPENRKSGRSVQRVESHPEVVEFRQRMQTERAKQIYRQRAQIAESPHLWFKAKFGVRQFHVRGLLKVGMEACWLVLTYNISQWIRLRWKPRLAPAGA